MEREQLYYTTIPLIFYLIFLVVVIAGCAVFIGTIAKNKTFHVGRWYLLTNLSFCDILFSVVVGSFEVGILIMEGSPEYENFCRVKATAYGITFVSSMLSVAMALVEHFLAITFPNFHKQHVSISNTMMMVFLSWLFSICFTVAAEILLFDPFTYPVEEVCVHEVKFCPTFIDIVWAAFSVVAISTVITYIGCLFVDKKKMAEIAPEPTPSATTGEPPLPLQLQENYRSISLQISPQGEGERKESTMTMGRLSHFDQNLEDNSLTSVTTVTEVEPQIQRRKALDEATLALGMVAASHLVVWFAIGMIFYMTSLQVEKQMNVARNFIILLSSSIHPLVYYLRVEEFQEAVKKLLRRDQDVSNTSSD